MRTRTRIPARRRVLGAALIGLLGSLLAPAGGAASPTFQVIAPINGGPVPQAGIVRTKNGTLHLVYQTFRATSGIDGLATRSITASGVLGPQVQVLSGWQTTIPGLVALPSGTLEATFGAISPTLVSSIWGTASSDGGSTWSAPADVRSGPLEPFGYAADETAAMSNGTPVLTLPQAGNLVIQKGLGANTPTYQVNNTTDGSVGGVDSAVDAATGEVVASWNSLATTGGLYLQGVAPVVSAPQHAPGTTHDTLVLAGRDTGPGVFGAYTLDSRHVRLLRYGGGTVAVGSRPGVTAADLGVATGLDGRIWVMWGAATGGLAVTRSNRAVTKFEPIQHVEPHAFSLYRMSGDGRLGPLDLIVQEITNFKGSVPPPRALYARILPQLSAAISVKTVKNKAGKVTAHTLRIHVTDAGDAVAGATASAKGHHKKTSVLGVAKLNLPGSSGGRVTVTITRPGYQALKKTVKL